MHKHYYGAPIRKPPPSSHDSSKNRSSSPKRYSSPRRFLHPRVPRGWTFPTYPTESTGYIDLESTSPRPVNIHHHYDMHFKAGQTISPSYLFNVRILQVALALVYLVLLCYCGVHHGWWLNLHQPLSFGISASLLTILIAIPDILKRDFMLSTTLSTYLFHFVRVLVEFLLIALWCAAFVTMLLPKGKDFRLLFHRPPYVQWYCAAVFAAIELTVFIWSMGLVLQEKYTVGGTDNG